MKKNLNVPSVLHSVRAPSSTPPVSTTIQMFKSAKTGGGKPHSANRTKKIPNIENKIEKQTKFPSVNNNLTSTPIQESERIAGFEVNYESQHLEQKHSRLKQKLVKHKQEQLISEQSDSQQADNEGSSLQSRNETDTDTTSEFNKHSEVSLRERLDKYMTPLTSGIVALGKNTNNQAITSESQINKERKVKSRLKTKPKKNNKRNLNDHGVFEHQNAMPTDNKEVQNYWKSSLPGSPRKYEVLGTDNDVEKCGINTEHETKPHVQKRSDIKHDFNREITDINVNIEDNDLVIEHIVPMEQAADNTNLTHQPSLNLPGRPQRPDAITFTQHSLSTDKLRGSKQSNLNHAETNALPTTNKAARATESLNEALEMVLDLGHYVSPIESNTDDLSFADGSLASGDQSLKPKQTREMTERSKRKSKPVFHERSIQDEDLSNVTYTFSWENEQESYRNRGKRSRRKKNTKETSSGESEQYFDSGSSFYSGRMSRDEIDDDLIRHIKSRESFC